MLKGGIREMNAFEHFCARSWRLREWEVCFVGLVGDGFGQSSRNEPEPSHAEAQAKASGMCLKSTNEESAPSSCLIMLDADIVG